MEAPANVMTPIIFAQNSVEVLCKAGINVEVKVQNWCESLGMGAFLLAGKGSCESPLFMEISYYGSGNFKERPIVLIGGIRSGLSTSAVGVFTNSQKLWKQLRISGIHTGDRVWRMPLFSHYTTKMTTSSSFDIKNYGRLPGSGEPCRCAAFLSEFVPCGEWLHMDNFGVLVSDGITDPPYLSRGMTGRPTRTLVEFLSQLCCRSEDC
ncbi:UNVERIFIED_CONTAM: hypothetical protein PYX00_003509 [Menopon gallinae]|uniref:Cytosol aminopeptidase domain-containing protein n=1 Tax=Menopon gallinae TaxID=328185 RepID=A0AAW2I1C1_9NEOP